MTDIERIRCTHRLAESLLEGGAFIGPEQLRAMLVIAHQEREMLLAEVTRLQAEAAAMREALGAVEWIFRTGTGYCPWCGKPFKSGHAPDCRRQLALAADTGREMLERLRRAEREWDEAREAVA